jgi:hypothetical protein
MEVGTVYTITLGKYSDKYLCVFDTFNGGSLRRVRTPKTKIDNVRLPENIHITEFSKPFPKHNKNGKK